jgi:two-component system, chemotaxis family, response regulator Rcp1
MEDPIKLVGGTAQHRWCSSQSVAQIREILIAEDNPADVRLIREALRPIDPAPNINVATDGEEALHFLGRVTPYTDAPKPNLVFLDFHLPKTDPREVLEFVKQSNDLCKTAVVVLTTSNNEELIREAYRLGANCYLSKPADLDAFFYTIRAAAEFWLNHPLMQ